jgi:hypothetical protein
LKEQSDAQKGVNRLCGGQQQYRQKKTICRNRWFNVVGDNGLEPVKQRTPFEGAKRRAKGSESLMRETIANRQKKNHLINRWFNVVGDNGLEPLTSCL